MKQERGYVSLNDESPFRMFLSFLVNVFFDLFKSFTYLDPTATIRIFSRFYNPHYLFFIFSGLEGLLDSLKRLIVIIWALSMERKRHIVEHIVVAFLTVCFHIVK